MIKRPLPDQWKIAKVTPLHKANSPSERSNYRPISVLPIISKILERHIHCSLYKYLTDYSLLTASQFGFRMGHSCELDLINLTDKLLSNMDSSLFNGLLLVDLKKAFDLVNHNTLIQKLKLYGFSPSACVAMVYFISR
jgi:hypothetical protein